MHMANEQYQQNSQTPGAVCKTGTSERLDSWASRLWRGIELVFKSLDCFFQPCRLLELRVFIFIFFGGGEGVLSSNAVTIWCCIPISRPPRVIRHFKRRSCSLSFVPNFYNDLHEIKLLFVSLWLCVYHVSRYISYIDQTVFRYVSHRLYLINTQP